MFSDPLFLATASIAAVLLVGLAKGGFSGIGMAATPLLALTMPPLQALAILLPILMMQDVISVWWYRHDWDGWNVEGDAAGRRDRRRASPGRSPRWCRTASCGC